MIDDNPPPPVCLTIGDAYIRTPDQSHEPAMRAAYAQYSRETARLFDLIKVRVEFTEADPYASTQEMRESILATGVMRVYSGGNEHPLLDPEANLKGRAVHDLVAHLVCGCPFTGTGEYNAFEAQSALYSVSLRGIIFTEIVGQTCAYLAGGERHAEQKVLVLSDELEKAAEVMRKKFKGMGLAGIIEAGLIDPAVLDIAQQSGYGLRYAYAVLETSATGAKVAANPAFPKWDKWLHPEMNVDDNPPYATRDRRTGQYSFSGDMDRKCVCGHRLGSHSEEPPHCCYYGQNERDDDDDTNFVCECQKFRLSRKKPSENPSEDDMEEMRLPSFNRREPIGKGFKYAPGEKEVEIETADGRRVKRMPGDGGDPSFHPEEVATKRIEGRRSFLFPPGQQSMKKAKHGNSMRAMPTIVKSRILATKLLDLYSPGYKTADGEVLPFDARRHAKRVADAEEFTNRTGYPQKVGVFHVDFERNGDPCFRFVPKLYTSDLIDDDGNAMIEEGWGGNSGLFVTKSEQDLLRFSEWQWKVGDKKPTPINEYGKPTFDYVDREDDKNPVIYKMVAYEFRGIARKGLTIAQVEAMGLEVKLSKGALKAKRAGKPFTIIVRHLEKVGLIEIPENGDWRLTERGRDVIVESSVYVTHAIPVSRTNFHVRTSKMGCASWNMPAGPPKIMTADFGGSCNAALPLNLFERLADREETGSIDPEDIDEDGDGNDDEVDEASARPLIQLKSAITYKLWRMEKGETLVTQARAIEKLFPGSISHTSDYHDDSKREVRVPLKSKDRDGKFKEKVVVKTDPGLICTSCYALKGNYAYLNNQFWQAVRYRWALAAMKAPPSLFYMPEPDFSPEPKRPPRKRPSVNATPRVRTITGELTTYFSACVAAAIKSYYAEENEHLRLPYGEDVRFYRVHDSGDFFSVEYILAWIEVAKACPDVRFWAPTRMWRDPASVAAFQQRPENFAIRPSAIHFEDAAPDIVGCSAGSTGAPVPLVQHWNCPATTHDRSACIGAMTLAGKYNDVKSFDFTKHLAKGESTCRVCWGGFPYMPPEAIKKIDSIPVSYKVH